MEGVQVLEAAMMNMGLTPARRLNPYPGLAAHQAGMASGMFAVKSEMSYAEVAKEINVPEKTLKAFWEDFEQQKAERTHSGRDSQYNAESRIVNVMLCVEPYDVLTEKQVQMLIDTATKNKEQRIKGWMTIADECGLGDVDLKTIHAAFKERGYRRPSLTKYQAKKDAESGD